MIQDYINLITPQHRSKPKFIAWLTAALGIINDIQDCLSSVLTVYDIDSATGKQLDSLGVILGVSRVLNFQPENGPSTMGDNYYRMVLKARVLKNQWDGKRSTYETMLLSAFPNDKVDIIDNQDMTAVVFYIAGSATEYMSELFSHGYLFPTSAGVGVKFIPATGPLFAFDYDNDILAGWDSGQWT